MPTKAPGSATEPSNIVIRRLGTATLLVPIIGTSPLIVHNWSEKAKRQMLDAQQGGKKLKEKRDPEADYEAAFYRLKDGRPGFPVLGFKAATTEATRHYDKAVSKVGMMQSLFFKGEYSPSAGKSLAPIEGDPIMREDVVTVGISGRDLRYRPEFVEWSTMLEIVYIKTAVSVESVLSLVDAGGLTVGVGEWRIQKKGDYGTYMVDPSRDVQVIDQ